MTAINRLHGGTTEEPGGRVVSVMIVYGNCHEPCSPKPSFKLPYGVILVSPLEITELRTAQRLLSAVLHYKLIADDPAKDTRHNH